VALKQITGWAGGGPPILLIWHPGAAWKRGLALTRLDVCGTPREAATHFTYAITQLTLVNRMLCSVSRSRSRRRNTAFAGKLRPTSLNPCDRYANSFDRANNGLLGFIFAWPLLQLWITLQVLELGTKSVRNNAILLPIR
jgi:hypothetical protein